MKTRLRPILHRLFFAGLALATLLGLGYAEENWRGAHVRAATERELAARGEPMQARDLIPPPVPDRENLALAPLFVEAFQYRFDHRTGLLTFGPREDTIRNATRLEMDNALYGPGNQSGANSPRSGGNWTTGHHRDLVGWQEYYRRRHDFPHAPEPGTPAADILLAQSRYAAIFDELTRAAAERPLTRFPINWLQRPAAGISLPHYFTLQTLVSALSLRASCHLAAGQSTEARRDLELAFRFTQAPGADPLLISHLVQMSCLGLVTQPLWEGLETRQWSAADLEAFGRLLGGFDALRGFQQSLRGERTVFLTPTVDDLRTASGRKDFFRGMGGDGSGLSSLSTMARIAEVCPQGWFDLNIALGERVLQAGIDAMLPAQGRVLLARGNQFGLTADNLTLRPDTFALKPALPVYHSQMVKSAQAQATLNQLIAACALERHFLDHQAYPAALAELVPAYLDRVPLDPIDGAPLRYRRTVDGRFQLYSIGLDEKDDGGAIEWTPNRPAQGASADKSKPGALMLPALDKNKADWVWQYAPAEPPDLPASRSRL